MQRETSAGTCTVYLMIWLNKLGQRMLPPVYLEVRLAAHEIKLLCTHQSVNHLARDWHIEGWGSALISEAGICLNVRPLPPTAELNAGWESTQGDPQKRDDQFPHLFPPNEFTSFFKRMQIKVTVYPPQTKWCYQRMETKQWLKGTRRNCCLWFFGMNNIALSRMIALEDQPSLLYFAFRWKTRTHFITKTHTFGFALCLHSPSVYQTFLCFTVISFTWFFYPFSSFHFLPLLFPFILLFFLSACQRGNWKQRWNPLIELFLIHAVFPCKYAAVECKQVNAAAGWSRRAHVGDVGYRWDTAQSQHSFLSHFSCHSKPKHTSSQQS